MDQDDVLETTPSARCLQKLDILWMEYKFETGGNKLLKLFAARERGEVIFFIVIVHTFQDLG